MENNSNGLEKHYLGKTNHLISKIGLGTVQFGIDYGFTKKKTQEEVNQILQYSINNGINFIDTAREYGDSEEKIGRFISENNNNFIISTKLQKIPENKLIDPSFLKKSVYKSIETSLNNLRLQKLDILQLHQTDDYLVTNPDFWLLIDELKSQKIIGSFGVSVYEETFTMNLIESYPDLIDFVQIPFNIFDQRFSALESFFNKNQIGIVSRSTFLKGIIPCHINNMPKELHGLISHKKSLEKIANNLSISIEAIALLFVYYNRLNILNIAGC